MTVADRRPGRQDDLDITSADERTARHLGSGHVHRPGQTQARTGINRRAASFISQPGNTGP